MKFGIFDHLDASGQRLDLYYEERLKLAELYDRAGFYGYHLAEHHATPLGMAPSPSVFLAAVAQRTKTLRFGPLVYALPLYHPLRLVQEIAMLDQMSGGRLDIGFGRGASVVETGYFGGDHAESERIYREYLDLILAGLETQRLDGRAGPYLFNDVPLQIAPCQKPHPPLWYGVHSLDSAERAARMGSHVVSLDTAAETRTFAGRFREVWAEAGDGTRPDPLVGLGVFIVVGDSDAEALAAARRAYPVWHESFNYLMKRHGTSTVHPRPPNFDGMAEQGRAVAGAPGTVASFLAAKLEESAASYLVGQMAFGDLTYDEARRSIELFAAEVMPVLRTVGP